MKGMMLSMRTLRTIHIIQYYWPIFVVPLGLVGNCLTFLVMVQPQNQGIPCSVYMAGIAVMDAIMTCMSLVSWLAAEYISEYVDGHVLCKLNRWAFQWFSLTGTLLVLFMTLDRVLVVHHPIKAKAWCTPLRARITVLITFLASALYTFPYYHYANVGISTMHAVACCIVFSEPSSTQIIFSWLTFCFNSVVVFVGLTTMNIYIVTGIRKSKEMLEALGQAEGKLRSRERQLTVMLLANTSTYLILTLPIYTRCIYYLYLDPFHSSERYNAFMLAYHVTNKLFYMKYAINFLLYAVTGSKFRQDVRKIFHCSFISFRGTKI